MLFIQIFLFALVSSVTPGPVNVLALSSGSTFGFKRTVSYIWGATLGFNLVLTLNGIFTSLLTTHPWLVNVLTVLGAGYLLYLAWKLFTLNDNIDTLTLHQAPSFMQGALCQILNPKAWLASLACTSLFVQLSPHPSLMLLILNLAFMLTCLFSFSLWAMLGLTLQRWLSRPHYRRRFHQTMGVLLAGTVFSLVGRPTSLFLGQ